MIKKLTLLSDNVSINLDRNILEQANISEHDSVEVIVENNAIVLRSVNQDKKGAMIRTAQRILTRHHKTFEELAK